MKKFIFHLSLFLVSFYSTTFAQETTINDQNSNGLPDQHESAVLRAAERICNMPGIQEVLMKQIDDLKNEKAQLQKQIDNLKVQFEAVLKDQQSLYESKLKDSQNDKEKVQLNLNDKSEQLIMCEAKLEQKGFDRLISAGLGFVGASSCFLYQELK
jgi:chromosome segregation ATPase